MTKLETSGSVYTQSLRISAWNGRSDQSSNHCHCYLNTCVVS